MLTCLQSKKEKHTNSRRVTPINGDPDGSNSKIHNVNISQDTDMFAYDGSYSNNGGRGGDGYETQPQYTYGWDF